ncbi:MAG: PAS domain-containing protein [Chloroflexota bacterium]|nr:PAS domain-containing protein [Chloroflexota bacterium]
MKKTPQPSRITILNVNDDNAVRYAIGRVLRRAEFEVVEAATGEEALRLAREHPDLIILDAQLPDITGFEVCQQLKADPATSSIPVLYLSAVYLDDQHRAEGLDGGADGYLTAPVEPSVLVSTVRMLLRVRQAEADARMVARQWQTTFDAIGDAVSIIDLEGRILHCNEAMVRLVQKPPNEIVGNTCWELVHGTSEPIRECPIVRMRETGCRETGYLPLGDQWFDITVDPLLDEERNLAGAVHIITDITERKQIEEMLHENQRQLVTLMGNLPGMAYRCSNEPGWAMDFVSEGCIALTGYTPAELTDTDLLLYGNLIHPKDRAMVWEIVQKAVQAGKPFVVEYRLYDKKGREKWVWEQGQAVGESNDGTAVLEGFISDITERKRGEETLRESEHNLLEAQRITHIGSWVWNLDTGEVVCSDEMLRIWGYRPEKGILTIQEVMQRTHPNDRDRVRKALERAVEDGVRYEAEFRVVLPNGNERIVHGVGQMEQGSKGQPSVLRGTGQDVTERKRAEKKLQEYSERLERMVEERTAALQESEEKTKAQYKGIPIPTYTWQKVGKDLVLVDYNDAADTITQGKVADFTGVKLSEMYRDTPEIQEDILKCMAQKTTIEREMLYRFQGTGESRYLAVKYAFVPPDLVLVHTEDVTERTQAENLARVQRDLGLALSTAHGLENTLGICVEAALNISEMDCGGVYLLDSVSGDLDLAFHTGLPADLVASSSHYSADSANARVVTQGKPVYTHHQKLGVPLDEMRQREGLRAIAVIPVWHEDRAIACLNVASHTLDEVPDHARAALETIATQIGNAITRARAEEEAKKRTAELQKFVNLMAGREIRMAGLKDVIRKLRAQLEEAGLKPVADDPLLTGREDSDD